jgi:CRISPR-associated protein Cas2
MKRTYIVCYDVCEPKRLSRARKTMKGFGDPLQYSVFVCSLSEKEYVLMAEAIKNVINEKEDSVLILDLGLSEDRSSLRMEFMGVRKEIRGREAVVV